MDCYFMDFLTNCLAEQLMKKNIAKNLFSN